ncbi:MAG: anthranilate synthase component I [Candidatus Omnitrophica bacterium]|nr:anthranilate synthase component I [Candidatus Omnitrophota bacterium]MDD5487469.1 anthranilate synthase component I [Candidatus Omnitrophota bacterium]
MSRAEYYPSKKEFLKLAGKGNVIPVYREMLADFDTPLSAFLKIDKGPFSYLLESVEGGKHVGRYSFLGSDPSLVIESKGADMKVRRGPEVESYKTSTDPIDEVRSIMKDFRFVPVKGLPRFCGGLVGYIGYDMVRFVEEVPDNNPEELDMPDMQLVLTDTILIFDHVDHKIKIVSNAILDGDASGAYDAAVEKIGAIVEKMRLPVTEPKVSTGMTANKVESNFTESAFGDAVEKAKEYIRAGEIIQIVLSQRFRRRTGADPFSVYRALRSINPSPYMYYLKFGDQRIVGSSPEILVRCEDGNVEIRPIAGTRKRGESEEKDIELEKELLADPKERAEHVMLVDLGRNDIGRVCEYSSVKTLQLMHIERYSHVMHIVSDIVGKLGKDKDVYDLIRATFPAGTVSGAPKVRAMELIDELENLRRGLYAGCIGYISFSGNIDMCITIRTIIMDGDEANIQAGAGIVLDSDPVNEFKETVNKAMAMMKAIDFAEEGLE